MTTRIAPGSDHEEETVIDEHELENSGDRSLDVHSV
jgi:hypothetical protein